MQEEKGCGCLQNDHTYAYLFPPQTYVNLLLLPARGGSERECLFLQFLLLSPVMSAGVKASFPSRVVGLPTEASGTPRERLICVPTAADARERGNKLV